MFAGMWQLEIHTWGRDSGGPGSGLFISRDGGVTWAKLTGRGLPTKTIGKVMPAIAHSNPKRVYAAIETGDGLPVNGQQTDRGQLWRSDDGGDSWRMVNTDRNVLADRVYARMAVATDNENETYSQRVLPQVDRRRRDAGGDTGLEAPGGDHHDMWIDPTNANRMIVAHDRACRCRTPRPTWLKQRTTNAQLYHITTDNQIPYYVYTNKQDGPSPWTEQQPPRRGRRSRRRWRPRRDPARHVAFDRRRGVLRRPIGRSQHRLVNGIRPGSVGGIVASYEESRRQCATWRCGPTTRTASPDLK
jgi:hypothetical protein